jgi:hypothetical protein
MSAIAYGLKFLLMWIIFAAVKAFWNYLFDSKGH